MHSLGINHLQHWQTKIIIFILFNVVGFVELYPRYIMYNKLQEMLYVLGPVHNKIYMQAKEKLHITQIKHDIVIRVTYHNCYSNTFTR